MKSSGGEIIQVQGGHIVRSTGRKDRHSKVFTAKGTRDRRVRLSAHTAIQFYDVQDRLGYDRPSKAVDWLIKKAKTAIDKLAELPPWNPTAAAAAGPDANAGLEAEAEAEDPGAGSNEMSIAEQGGYNFQVQNQQLVDAPQTPSSNNNSGFVGSSMDPDPMKSLFPSSYRVEDLGLSLHPFQNQSLIHSQPHQGNTSHSVSSNEQTLFAAPTDTTGFEPGNSFQRMVGWGNDGAFNPVHFYHHHHQQQQQQQQQQAMMLGHGPAFSQRGTLQSSFFQSVRAWNDLAMVPADHSRTTQDFHHQSLVFGTRFAPDGLSSGFAVPARIHGEDEQSQSVVSDGQPSSSSPVSQQ